MGLCNCIESQNSGALPVPERTFPPLKRTDASLTSTSAVGRCEKRRMSFAVGPEEEKEYSSKAININHFKLEKASTSNF